jgi:hypothetical protein
MTIDKQQKLVHIKKMEGKRLRERWRDRLKKDLQELLITN